MVSLASAQTVVVGTSSTAANLPYSHAAGKGVLCFVGVRLTASTDSVTTVSFNGSNFTQIFDSGPAGGASPYQRLYGFRLDDPGAANATIVATGSTTILGWNLAAFDVDGAQTGAAMVDNAATAIANSSVTVSCTLTTSSPDAYLVAVQTRAPGASMVSLSVSAPLTEFFELKGTNGAGYLVQMEGSTYQTSVSGIASYAFFPSTATAARRCVGIVGLARVLPTSLCASPVTVVTGFGAAPIAVPQGFASPTAFGSVGTPVPLGKAVNAQFGGVAVAVPQGRTVAIGAGGIAVAVPGGFATSTAFGTPVISQGASPLTVNATGFSVTTTGGRVSIAVPLGNGVTGAFGGVAFAVPSGTIVSTAFGAPNVTVSPSLSPVVTTTQLAGRVWARGGFGWDDLITRWKHLQSLRQEARAALVEVRTKLRKAPSAQQQPYLRGQEDDLEERIDELRRQALMLEAEIVSIDHKARADLLADDEEAIMLLL